MSKTVKFTSNVTSGSSPYKYIWDFGDGNGSNEPNPSHTYKNYGTYTVSLTIEDKENNNLLICKNARACPNKDNRCKHKLPHTKIRGCAPFRCKSKIVECIEVKQCTNK